MLIFKTIATETKPKRYKRQQKIFLRAIPLTENFYILFALIFLSHRNIKNSDLIYYMTLIILDQGPIFYLLTT